jgi:hypothetical protein
MKQLTLSTAILLITFGLFGQKQKNVTPTLPFDDETKRITYSEVVTVDSSTTKNELYSRGREWFAKAYKSSTDVLQMDDKESGKIVGKALMQVYHKALGSNYKSGYINYTISLYLKDGRYKYEMTNFHHTGQYAGNGNSIPDYGVCEDMVNTTKKTMGMSYQKAFNYYLMQMHENIKDLILDLKTTMSKRAEVKKKDDW